MKITIPKNVKFILDALELHGYEGYIVGGCVRDSFLGKIPKDWDITTNATPEQVKKIFSRESIIPTGEKHGTLTLMKDREPFEITTYRIDGKYTDGRRPDEVKFAETIEEDLSRRDFTINAMAYSPNRGLVDPFNGRQDLEKKIIKCVGNPYKRFSEDFLRIVRAYRFTITLNFSMDAETHEIGLGLMRLDKLKNISVERLQMELIKMLSSDIPFISYNFLLEILDEYRALFFKRANWGLSCKHEEYHYCSHCRHYGYALEFHLKNLNFEQKLFILLRKAIFSDLKEQSNSCIASFLNELKFSNETQYHIKSLLELYKVYPIDIIELKFYIREYGFDLIREALQMRYEILASNCFIEQTADEINTINNVFCMLSEIQSENQVVDLKQLAIDGNDLIKELNLIPSKRIGQLLENALKSVITNQTSNTKKDLLIYLKSII